MVSNLLHSTFTLANRIMVLEEFDPSLMCLSGVYYGADDVFGVLFDLSKPINGV